MNPLPPLQTVRRSAADTNPVTPPPAASPRPAGDFLPLPPAARALVGELLHLGLVDTEALPAFVAAVGTRANLLTTREKAAEALIGLKVITRYVATRTLAGQTRGLVLGNYRVLDRLSSGSVGVVFRGEHALLGRPVAIKEMAVDGATSSAVLDRFRTEIRLMARLDDPHVVAVHDAGRLPADGPGAPEIVYVVLELLAGGDVEQAVTDAGPRPPAVACAWGRQAALGLCAAHAVGVVHRDVKPSNLLLTAAGAVKLVDFGLARDFGSTRTPPRTLLGSLEFMAPEQLADAPTAGEAADVYGLGATLFWVLTGHVPYPQERSSAAAIAAIRGGPPRRLRDIRPDLPAALDALLSRMLTPAPGGRPTMRQVVDELAAFAPPADDDIIVSRQAAATAAIQVDQARAAVWAGLAAAAGRAGGDPGRPGRVGELSRVLAGRLSAGPDWVTFADPKAAADLAHAAAVHDLGVVDVPDEVLATVRAGVALTPSERHLYEQHPLAGEAVLDRLAAGHAAALPALRMVRAAVRHHHERWDGGGFPDKLAGDAIPPAARIVAVAAAYDALRATLPAADAVAVIQSQAGAAFDPAVCAALAAGDCDGAVADGGSLAELILADE